MKTTSFVGFFQEKDKVRKASNSLQIAGFKPSNIIVQDHDNHPLMVCATLSDSYDMEMAVNIFRFHGVDHTYTFNGIIDNAEDLKKIISIHSKQQIFTPAANRHHDHREGMTSEVTF